MIDKRDLRDQKGWKGLIDMKETTTGWKDQIVQIHVGMSFTTEKEMEGTGDVPLKAAIGSVRVGRVRLIMKSTRNGTTMSRETMNTKEGGL